MPKKTQDDANAAQVGPSRLAQPGHTESSSVMLVEHQPVRGLCTLLYCPPGSLEARQAVYPLIPLLKAAAAVLERLQRDAED